VAQSTSVMGAGLPRPDRPSKSRPEDRPAALILRAWQHLTIARLSELAGVSGGLA
jgi:hypothetical protein